MVHAKIAKKTKLESDTATYTKHNLLQNPKGPKVRKKEIPSVPSPRQPDNHPMRNLTIVI